ncbi:hypothetical protein ACHAW6_006130 [Cyclotella cf. meneghiniana]
MPKHQKEKQYQSAREHRANQSLYSNAPSSSSATRPLPFDCCALTLTPYITPVCTPDGIIFENSAIFPHLMQYKADPVTGNPMTSRDLIVLHMDKDESTGKWQCPVLNKTFTDRTKVVAIRQSGGNEANVYSYEAYHELNVKAKNYVDLISGLKFDKLKDVIVLQDPENEIHRQLRDIQNFKHIQSMREERERLRQSSLAASNADVRRSLTASRIMDKIEKEKRKRQLAAEDEAAKLLKTNNGDVSAFSNSSTTKNLKIYTDELFSAVNLTSGKASGSFTSTSMNITSNNSSREATEEEIIASQCEQLKRLKRKGIIRMFTNMGAMDIELHCDIVPRTAMNFLLLAEKGDYNGSKFHRSIPNFMIQGGKNSKEKGEGSSYWKSPFQDEFDDRLTHTGQGILSMANSGPNTNTRQFFITYKSCPHLNRKHSVFGKVIGGLEVLRRLEQLPTDKETDRPLEAIKIEEVEILENPVKVALELERERILKLKEEKKEADHSRKSGLLGLGASNERVGQTSFDDRAATSYSAASDKKHTTVCRPLAVGKYLKTGLEKEMNSKSLSSTVNGDKDASDELNAAMKSRLPPPPKKTTFGNFSGW